MDDVEGLWEDYRVEIRHSLKRQDWHSAYRWAKGWIGNGGSGSVEPWLVYVAASLQQGQRKIAVRSTDLALRHWIVDDRDRALLLYVRGQVVWQSLRDPKTAVHDLIASEDAAPAWLKERVTQALERCEQDAATSRKRKASVGPPPDFTGARPGSNARAPGPPSLWEDLRGLIVGS